MKLRNILLSSLCAVGATAGAQTFHIGDASVQYSFDAASVGVMNFGPGETLAVGGRIFALDSKTCMYVDEQPVEENVVTVTYAGTTARVDIAGNLAPYVEATVAGADVTIVQSAEVSAETCGEITYRLAGNSDDGSFSIIGAFKATVELAGVSLTNTKGAPLDIQIGKRVAVKPLGGTSNSFADCANGSQKGCIVCKGHLEFKNSGEINVTGKTSHAIYAKEYIEMANCTVKVLSAVKDGVNCNQYFKQKSGNLTIAGTGDDGIQVSFKDEIDREAEDTGEIIIAGGTTNISDTAEAAKAMKCEGPMTVSGGEITASVTGHGIYDTAKAKTKASSCLNSDMDITISGGTLNLTATGGGGKGLSCDGKLTVSGGEIDIKTSGGVLAYVNNTLYTNYTGNTDRLDSDMKSSAKGIKVDGDVEINGGVITVTTTGNGAEGIESKSILTINDGTVTVRSTDDGINSSSHMYIKGGTVCVIATGNDGLDSNGNLYIQGGYIMAFGARSPECGIDANEEEGYTVIFSGGTLLAVGGNNSYPSSSSGSTQPYVSGSGSVSANSEIALSDSSGAVLATFTVPTDYSSAGSSGGFGPGSQGGSSILVTCPGLSSGTQYKLRNGSSTSNVTARLTGSSGGRPW